MAAGGRRHGHIPWGKRAGQDLGKNVLLWATWRGGAFIFRARQCTCQRVISKVVGTGGDRGTAGARSRWQEG